jgi:hypothetical protein
MTMGMSKQARWTVAGAGAATALAVTAVLLVTGGSPTPPAQDPAALGVADAPATSLTTTSAATTTTTSAAVSTTTTTAKASTTRKAPTKTTMPPPTAHPVDIPVPPPAHPAPVPDCAPTLTGVNAAKPDVKAALVAAAGKQYWAHASNPPMVAVDPPDTGTPQPAAITIPPALIEAIAWQESGWQSAIKACDGGIGTMQIMDATASWMNQRFGTSYPDTSLAGNVAIGAEYLEWLIAYFGENNFGHHYDITDPDLLTAVIVGYNAGAGAVQFSGGHTVASHYATTVKALMTSQPWA